MENIFRIVAERRIQEAIDEGKFDNLPGKGKPLDLEEDMSTPAHLRVANRILKNAGVVPDWMQIDAEIDRERDAISKKWDWLGKEYPRRKTRALAPAGSVIGDPEKRKSDFARWLVRQRAEYLFSLRRVNTDITKLLMSMPSLPKVHKPYNLEAEMARFDDAFAGLPGVEAPPAPEFERDDAVKETVRALYSERLRRGGGR
jgi:hypothetical protein